MSEITHYDILEVPREASREDIRRAYKEGIKITHPDRHGGKGGHLFILIEEAWQVLSNEDTKAEYDSMLDGQDQAANQEYAEPVQEEPDWGEETVWGEEDIEEDPAAFPPPPPPTGDSSTQWQDQGAGGTDIPQPEFDARHTPWMSNSQLENPEVFTPTKPGLLIPLILLGAMIISWVIGFQYLEHWVWVLALPSTLLGFYVIEFRGLTWERSLLPFGVIGGLFIGYMTWTIVIQESDYTAIPIILLVAAAFVALPIYTAFRWHKRSIFKQQIKQCFNMEQAGWKVLGRPGEGLAEAFDSSGRSNVALGQLGEQMTGDVLESLLEIPGTRVIHGLEFPGTKTADVDHVVLYGNKIALVDSKMWKPGYYAWNHRGEIVRDTGYRDLDSVTHFPMAVKKYANLFPDKQVGGFIVVHPNANGPVELDNTYSQYAEHVSLGTAQTALDAIGNWFLEDEDQSNVVDRNLLWRIWQHKQ